MGQSARIGIRCAGVMLATVAVMGGVALTATTATGQSGASQPSVVFTLTPEIQMVIKYDEGIPTEGDSNGQSPSLNASQAKRYTDPKGFCTIGWGHKCTGGEPEYWTFQTANSQLDTDIVQKAIDPLNACMPTVSQVRTENALPALQLSAGQMRALVDLVFSVGSTRASMTPSMRARNPTENSSKLSDAEVG